MITIAGRVPITARGLTDWFAGLPARRQEQVADLGLATVLAAVNVLSLLPYRAQLHPLWLALVLVAAQGLPLALRRSVTVGSAFTIGVARVAYDQIGFGFAPLPLGPAIAVYTIFERRGPAIRWLTVALIAVALTISEASPGHSEPYDAIFQVFIFATAGVAGLLSRARRASLEAATSRAERAEAELDTKAATAAAAERTRIARELHDVVAHHVSLMAVQSEAAAALLPDRPEQARSSVDVIGETARQALTELRRLLGVLRGPSERADMAPAASLADLDSLLAQVRAAGLAVDVTVSGEPAALAPGIELTAFRIVQEALTNTLRHAAATSAAVTVCYEPGFVTVGIADSGPRRRVGVANGRDISQPVPILKGSGLGLAGIAERVAACGGNLTVGPTDSSGFALSARLPAQ